MKTALEMAENSPLEQSIKDKLLDKLYEIYKVIEIDSNLKHDYVLTNDGWIYETNPMFGAFATFGLGDCPDYYEHNGYVYKKDTYLDYEDPVNYDPTDHDLHFITEKPVKLGKALAHFETLESLWNILILPDVERGLSFKVDDKIIIQEMDTHRLTYKLYPKEVFVEPSSARHPRVAKK